MSGTIDHMSHLLGNERKILHVWSLGDECSQAGLGLQSGRRRRGWRWEGGPSWGVPSPGGSPFVAALATVRRSEAGDRPNLGRNPWEGEQSRTHNPSHPIPPAASQRRPCTQPPTSQFAVGTAYQPVCFLFPRIRTCEYERGHHSLTLFVPPVSVFCQSA